MSCLGCLHFVHKVYNGLKRSFSPRLEFMRSDASTRHGLSIVDSEEKLKAVKEICNLVEMHSAECSCEKIVPTLQVCLGVSLAISNTSYQRSSDIFVLTFSSTCMYSEQYLVPRHEKTCFLHILKVFEGLVRENKRVNFRKIYIFFTAVISPLATEELPLDARVT